MTFLLVNGACSLSDKFGRKPFMAVANMGLGAGQVIASFAKDPRLLLIGAYALYALYAWEWGGLGG